jgi:hypothetical protein
VSRVHGPVDHGNSAGPHVHYGQRTWDDRSSSDLGRSAAPVDGSLPPVREKEDEVWGVLTAGTRGFGDENEYGEIGGAWRTIYRGQVGHRRGTQRNKGHHQWRLSTRALGERKGMGQRWLLKGKRRGGQAAPMLVQRSWPEVNDRWRTTRITYDGGSSAQQGGKRRRFRCLHFRIEETEAS